MIDSDCYFNVIAKNPGRIEQTITTINSHTGKLYLIKFSGVKGLVTNDKREIVVD